MSLVCSVFKIREVPYLYVYFYYFLFLCYIRYIEFWYMVKKNSLSFYATFLNYMKLHKLHGRTSASRKCENLPSVMLLNLPYNVPIGSGMMFSGAVAWFYIPVCFCANCSAFFVVLFSPKVISQCQGFLSTFPLPGCRHGSTVLKACKCLCFSHTGFSRSSAGSHGKSKAR